MQSKKIGMFGGSFNPFHIGHINCIVETRKVLGLDSVMVIPAYKNPLKPMIESPTPEQRLHMTKLSCKEHDFIYVDDRDINRKGDSFTILSIKELEKMYSDIYLIMGADLFGFFYDYEGYDEIAKRVRVVVASRPGYEIKKGRDIIHVKLNDIDISASRLRDWIKKNDSRLYDYMNKEVVDFIKEQKLYLD